MKLHPMTKMKCKKLSCEYKLKMNSIMKLLFLKQVECLLFGYSFQYDF